MATNTPIATLALNPAIDLSYLVSELVPFRKTKAKNSRYDAGGNAVNVSRALKRLGKEAHTCCILAGESGSMLKHLLAQEGIVPESITVDGETRINSTIQQRRPPTEFKISGVAPSNISADEIKTITRRFLKLAADGYGVLTGSVPTGISHDLYAKLSAQLSEQGAKVVLDTKDNILISALDTKPYLIKPNVYELEITSGKSLPTIEAIAEQARQLQQGGVSNVCVSMGAEGAVFVNSEESYYAPAPRIRVMCSVGAGDAMVAGLLAGLVDELPAEEVLLQGLACGSGAVTQPGTMLFDPESLDSLKEELEVRKLGI
jgi:6-phosphofructokinase 2